MPNIASVLKEEISRIARREIRAETATLQKTVTSFRSEIADLKRRVSGLEKQAKRLTRQSSTPASSNAASEEKLRFRAQGLASHRQRLGLSAAQAAKLLGVSSLSVYNWESGKTRPRPNQLPGIAALRRMGKREVAVKLAA